MSGIIYRLMDTEMNTRGFFTTKEAALKAADQLKMSEENEDGGSILIDFIRTDEIGFIPSLVVNGIVIET